jgi:pimeloyl-ACP methyl ester carboxylesterase
MNKFNIHTGITWLSAFFIIILLSSAFLWISLFTTPYAIKMTSEPIPLNETIGKKNVTVNGHLITYIDEGDGSPILFVHGMGSSSDVFKYIVALMKHKYRCIAIDLPGSGGSEYQKIESLKAYADFLTEFMQELKLNKTTCVGHSFGGVVLSYMAYSRPNACEKVVDIEGALSMHVSVVQQKNFLSELKQDRVSTLDLNSISDPAFRNESKMQLLNTDYRALADNYNAAVGFDFSKRGKKIQSPILYIRGNNLDLFFSTSKTQLSIYKMFVKDIGTVYPSKFQLKLFRDINNLYPEEKFAIIVVDSPSHYLMLEDPRDLSKILDEFIEEKNTSLPN